ncbi:hypothetical protein COO91_09182 (plasmid) [Nostoc flagelliforme CCNUN1]|uniref:Uncharacterized protein n=1 Tax=Nostoc flagelliforme CCNUN1 TaxID=2038116 RepID=A0A2K8T5P1_9NOSO|nr:hypothetical protein [Nostoc flagelliforme]AUB43026.1 hypothetical protein COO91_09182 [Nostoc flagelliforme CCNUN1]
MAIYKDEGDVIEITLPHEAQETLDAIAVIKVRLEELRSNPESVDIEGDEEFQEAVEIVEKHEDIYFLSENLEELGTDPSKTNEILDDIFGELNDAEISLYNIIIPDEAENALIPESDLTDL